MKHSPWLRAGVQLSMMAFRSGGLPNDYRPIHDWICKRSMIPDDVKSVDLCGSELAGSCPAERLN